MQRNVASGMSHIHFSVTTIRLLERGILRLLFPDSQAISRDFALWISLFVGAVFGWQFVVGRMPKQSDSRKIIRNVKRGVDQGTSHGERECRRRAGSYQQKGPRQECKWWGRSR